jgi:hypothetical protein
MSRQLGPHPRAVFLDGSPWTTRLVGNNTTTTQVVEMYPLMKGARASGREFLRAGEVYSIPAVSTCTIGKRRFIRRAMSSTPPI